MFVKVETLIGGVNLLTVEKEPRTTVVSWDREPSFDEFMEQKIKEGRVLRDRDGSILR